MNATPLPSQTLQGIGVLHQASSPQPISSLRNRSLFPIRMQLRSSLLIPLTQDHSAMSSISCQEGAAGSAMLVPHAFHRDLLAAAASAVKKTILMAGMLSPRTERS